MSGDFEDWNPEPAKRQREKEDYKELKRERNVKHLVGALFLAAVIILFFLHWIGAIK